MKRVFLASIMHIQAVNKGRCEPSAGVDAGGQGTAVAFCQPDDDRGSDPSKSAHPQREWLCTRSLRAFQSSWT